MRLRIKMISLITLVAFLVTAPAGAWDPIGVVKASDNLAAAAAKLPEGLKDTLGVSIVSLSNEMKSRIADVQNIIPVMGREMSAQLDHAAFIGEELAKQVNIIAEQRITQISDELQKQLLLMQKIIGDSLAEIDRMVEGWIEQTEGAAVRVVEKAGARAMQVIDQVQLYLIRFVSLALLLLGLLLIGLRLLAFWGTTWNWQTVRDNKQLSAILSVVFTCFFSVTLMLAIFPESLASLSAQLKAIPYDNPCRQLRKERSIFLTAQGITDPTIKKELAARISQTGKECLKTSKIVP